MANEKGNELASFTKIKINPERPFTANNPQYKDPSRVRDVDEYGWRPNKNAKPYWGEKKDE